MPTVLIVDDHGTTRRMMCRLFEKEGFVPVEASDGDEALEVLGTLIPDLVLLDLEMPRLPGLSVLESLRQRACWREIPVVVLTGVSDTQTVNHVRQMGARQHMTKTAFSVRELLDVARELSGNAVHA